mgnify:CR=1 FL=1
MNFFDLSTSIDLSVLDILIRLFTGLLLSLLIVYHYNKNSNSLSDRNFFSRTFPLILMTTLLVISVVKSSLALSLGLVGALSIVRFRAAIKEPEELVYLFLIITIGLAAGAGQLLASFSITIFSVVAIYIRSYFRTNNYKILSLGDVDILSISAPNADIEIFDKYSLSRKPALSYELMSMTSEKGTFRATYRLNSDISESEKKELLNWISKVSNKNVSISLSKTMKIDQ